MSNTKNILALVDSTYQYMYNGADENNALTRYLLAQPGIKAAGYSIVPINIPKEQVIKWVLGNKPAGHGSSLGMPLHSRTSALFTTRTGIIHDQEAGSNMDIINYEASGLSFSNFDINRVFQDLQHDHNITISRFIYGFNRHLKTIISRRKTNVLLVVNIAKPFSIFGNVIATIGAHNQMGLPTTLPSVTMLYNDNNELGIHDFINLRILNATDAMSRKLMSNYALDVMKCTNVGPKHIINEVNNSYDPNFVYYRGSESSNRNSMGLTSYMSLDDRHMDCVIELLEPFNETNDAMYAKAFDKSEVTQAIINKINNLN